MFDRFAQQLRNGGQIPVGFSEVSVPQIAGENGQSPDCSALAPLPTPKSSIIPPSGGFLLARLWNAILPSISPNSSRSLSCCAIPILSLGRLAQNSWTDI